MTKKFNIADQTIIQELPTGQYRVLEPQERIDAIIEYNHRIMLEAQLDSIKSNLRPSLSTASILLHMTVKVSLITSDTASSAGIGVCYEYPRRNRQCTAGSMPARMG
jgi:hypothetical protein